MLSHYKCLFEQIGANLAHIQPENLQNVQKVCFWQKVLGGNGLIKSTFYRTFAKRIVLVYRAVTKYVTLKGTVEYSIERQL